MRGAIVRVSLAFLFAAGACKEVRLRRSERVVVELTPIEGTSGEKITISEDEYRRELARVRVEREGLNAPPLSLELKEALLDSMVDRRLLMIEAHAKNVRASTVAVAREIATMRASLPAGEFEKKLIQTYQTQSELETTIGDLLTTSMLVKQEALDPVRVTDEDAKKLWDSLPPEDHVKSARVHASQIVVATEEEGKLLHAQLKKGTSFEDLARRKSAAPEAVRGGDLGWFEAGVMPSVFDEVCFSLKPGDLSEVTVSEYGYHIFKVLETEPERPLTFDEMRPALISRIHEERARDAETAYLEGLRQRVKVVKNAGLIASIE